MTLITLTYGVVLMLAGCALVTLTTGWAAVASGLTRRRARQAVGVALLLAALAPQAAAQTSWTRIDLQQAPNVEALLVQNGYDLDHDAPAGAPPGFLDLLIPNSDLPRLASLGISYQVLEQSISLNEAIALTEAPAAQFYDWPELEAEMAALEAQYPGIAKKVDITALSGGPQTHGGRSISALKISDNVASDEDEPNILYVGNHHAREIATPAHMVQWMRDLCAEYSTDPQVQDAVDRYEIWVVPTMNPDGLEHVWNVDQWWRKNRRNNGNGTWGVDLNRNYPYRWAYCGSYSNNPSSETYVGPSAGSEPETQVMMGLARARHFVKVIDIHQSGREVLYGYPCANLPTAADNRVNAMRDALAAAANYVDRVPSASGEHYEWEYNEIGALSYLIELNTTFFPSWTSFQSEYARVKPAYRVMLFEPEPATGHVYDSETGQPIDGASWTASGVNWFESETRESGGAFGRWMSWLQDGIYTMTFDAPGYAPQTLAVELGGGSGELDIFLSPDSGPWVKTTVVPTGGLTMQFIVENATAHIGQTAIVVLSKTGGGPFVPGVSVGSYSVPLVQDSITTWSQGQSALRANVLAGGTAVGGLVTVPMSAVGWTIWASAVFLQGGVQGVTPALTFEVQ